MGPLPWGAMVVLSIFGFVYTLGVWRLFSRERIAEAAGWLGGGFLLMIVLFYGWYVPSAPYLSVSKRLATLLHQVNALASDGARLGDVPDVACVSYRMPVIGKDGEVKQKTDGWLEPSMDFYQGGTLEHYDEDHLLERHAPEYWPRVMIITRRTWDESPESIQAQLRVVGKVRGLSYAVDLRGVELWVVEKIPAPPESPEPWPAATQPTSRPVGTGMTHPAD